MDLNERAELRALQVQLLACRRQNARLRQLLLHRLDCPTCRISWCSAYEKLADEALGRARQTFRIPPR